MRTSCRERERVAQPSTTKPRCSTVPSQDIELQYRLVWQYGTASVRIFIPLSFFTYRHIFTVRACTNPDIQEAPVRAHVGPSCLSNVTLAPNMTSLRVLKSGMLCIVSAMVIARAVVTQRKRSIRLLRVPSKQQHRRCFSVCACWGPCTEYDGQRLFLAEEA